MTAQVEVRDGDVIAGLRPRLAFAPASIAEAAEVMARAARDGLRLGFVGGGTALELGAAPAALDAVVRTEQLARIVEYAPADMVIVVEAGVMLAALQATVAAHGQRLALDAPWPARATVGGVIATAASGPLRMRYGTVRDLIIGVTLIRADGAVAHGGGKVVKNVAGFDLPKVACGSLGTLGLIAGAAFRLHPLPEVTATVVVGELAAEAVVAVMAAARDAQLEPAAAVALRTEGARFELGVRFEGFGRGVAEQVARFSERAHASGARTVDRDDAGATAFWHRHDAVRTSAPLRIRVAGLPSQLPAIAPRLAMLDDFAWYPAVGVGYAGGAAAEPAELEAARTALIAGGGSLVIEAAPAAVRAAIDAWGPRPAAFAIMQRLKQRFDPERRLSPGRFVGGL